MKRNNKIEVGDLVSVIDEPITGEVVRMTPKEVVLKTEDGFEMLFLMNEVVKIQKNDVISVSYEDIHNVIKEKEIHKKKPKRQVIKSKNREVPPMEVDLHIEKLVSSTRGMTSYDIVTLQLDTAKRQLDFAIHKRIPRVVFIHGIGQGVLKEELRYLFGKYDNVNITDADYKKYGLGAMEVYIIQNPK